MKKQQAVFAGAVVVSTWCVAGIAADEVALPALKDNTLYEDKNGQLSNGMGDFFFTGKTQQGPGIDRRRGLLAFDLSAIPAGSVITSAVLHLECSMVHPGSPPHDVSLHRALADWGEGNSDAFGNEGIGDGAQAGDATWLHTFYDTQFWANVGGDFAATPSATTVVSTVGPYSWGPTAEMAADVQHWMDNPSENFGWVVVGDESTPGSAKRFNSLQNPLTSQRPRLVVNFDPPAALTDVAVQFGTYISGNTNSLRNSDDQYYVVRSQFGFAANERNITEIRVGFIAGSSGPTMRVTFEGKLDHPAGSARVFARDWSNGSNGQIGAFPINQTEMTHVIDNVSTTNRIRFNDQRIEISVRNSTLSTFTVVGFLSSTDMLRVNVQP